MTNNFRLKKTCRLPFLGEDVGLNGIVQEYIAYYGNDMNQLKSCIYCYSNSPIQDNTIAKCEYREHIISSALGNPKIIKYWHSLPHTSNENISTIDHYDRVMEQIAKRSKPPYTGNDKGYRITTESDPLTSPVRTIHKLIKGYMIQKYGNMVKGNVKCVLDLCCGRATEATRWLQLKPIPLRVIGIDDDIVTCDEGNGERLSELQKSFPALKKIKYDIYHFDAGKLLHDTKDADASTQMVSAIFKQPSQFQLVTCFFGMHYLVTDDKFENFVINVARNLSTGGYFLLADLDRDAVMELFLPGSPLVDGTYVRRCGDRVEGYVDDKSVWSITFTGNPCDPYQIGEKIGVTLTYISGNDDPKYEYLVSFQTNSEIDSMFNKHGLQRVECYSFSELTPKMMGMMDNNKLTREIKNVSLKKNLALKIWKSLHSEAAYIKN